MNCAEDRFAYEGDRSVDLWTRTRAEKQTAEADAIRQELIDFARRCAERLLAVNPDFVRRFNPRTPSFPMEPGEAIEGFVEGVEDNWSDFTNGAALSRARMNAEGRDD